MLSLHLEAVWPTGIGADIVYSPAALEERIYNFVSNTKSIVSNHDLRIGAFIKY